MRPLNGFFSRMRHLDMTVGTNVLVAEPTRIQDVMSLLAHACAVLASQGHSATVSVQQISSVKIARRFVCKLATCVLLLIWFAIYSTSLIQYAKST